MPREAVSKELFKVEAMLTLDPERDPRGRGAQAFEYRARVVVWAPMGCPQAVFPGSAFLGEVSLFVRSINDRQEGACRGARATNERPGPPREIRGDRPQRSRSRKTRPPSLVPKVLLNRDVAKWRMAVDIIANRIRF